VKKKIRINQFLAMGGVASRRKVEKKIEQKEVYLNGKVATQGALIDPTKDQITLKKGASSKKIRPQKKVYYLLNKPMGYVCSNRRLNNEKLAIDLIPGNTAHLFTVGRLDKKTTGLIIVTSDGDFAQSVIHPSHNISKEYLVKTKQDITEEHLKKMSRGTKIDGKQVTPLKVRKVRKNTVKIVLTDGKKREVRHLVADALLDLITLVRIRIGSIHLGNLPLGGYRKMTPGEISEFLGEHPTR